MSCDVLYPVDSWLDFSVCEYGCSVVRGMYDHGVWTREWGEQRQLIRPPSAAVVALAGTEII